MATATSSKECLYDVLGVTRDASPTCIRAAFREQSKRIHPDRLVMATDAEKAEATAKFKMVAAAYEVLSDETKRAIYDMHGHAGLDGAQSAAPPGFDDAAAQAMFEEMMMGGGNSEASRKRAKGVVGGNLYVVDGGTFVQRTLPSVDEVRKEAADGLPALAAWTSDCGVYETRAALPAGVWEVRLVEVDTEARTLTVVCGVGESEEDGQESWQGLNEDELLARLRVSRPFRLPADAVAASAEIEVVGEVGCEVRVRVPVEGVAAGGVRVRRVRGAA